MKSVVRITSGLIAGLVVGGIVIAVIQGVRWLKDI